MVSLCVICGADVPPASKGVTCSYSCRARLRETRKTREWRLPKVYPADLVERVRHLYVDQGMTIAEVQATVGRGIKVQRLMENHGIPRRPTIKRDQRGARNDSWRGDDASYSAIHFRLNTVYGHVSEHSCVDCGTRASDWSYLGGCPRERRDPRRGCAYSPDPTRYAPRCERCHHIYDFRGRRPNGQWVRLGEAS